MIYIVILERLITAHTHIRSRLAGQTKSEVKVNTVIVAMPDINPYVCGSSISSRQGSEIRASVIAEISGNNFLL